MNISSVTGLRVWDSRGRPTIEVEVGLENGVTGRAIAPAGASTGSGEAVDLRDGGGPFGGYDVQEALSRLRDVVAPNISGMDVTDQAGIDLRLSELDGTHNFTHIGGNTAIATSMAVANAAAALADKPLWKYLRGDSAEHIYLPVPEVQIFGGGAHAEGQMDLQDFMVVPFGAQSFCEAMEWVAEIYRAAGSLLDARGLRYGVADEGGYWPVFSSNDSAIDALLKAIEMAGFNPETQVGMSLDIAATQFYRDGLYLLAKEEKALSKTQWRQRLAGWLRNFPIIMIEDPFVETDFESHADLYSEFGRSVQIVGDDLLVTNAEKVEKAASHKACNTLLCKPNQAGTLTKALEAAKAARTRDWDVIVSARSGETEDTTIVDLVMGWGLKQLKVGSFARSERMAKWNEVLRIEASLGQHAKYAGRDVFGKFLKKGSQT